MQNMLPFLYDHEPDEDADINHPACLHAARKLIALQPVSCMQPELAETFRVPLTVTLLDLFACLCLVYTKL